MSDSLTGIEIELKHQIIVLVKKLLEIIFKTIEICAMFVKQSLFMFKWKYIHILHTKISICLTHWKNYVQKLKFFLIRVSMQISVKFTYICMSYASRNLNYVIYFHCLCSFLFVMFPFPFPPFFLLYSVYCVLLIKN